MADTRAGGLHILFAIFLGLMVAAFVGVGVYTFYPSPERDFRAEFRSLDQQQQAISGSKPETALTADDRAKVQSINERRNRLYDESSALREAWSGRTSIILVSLATLVMAISLTAARNLPVISNGLLMGGVFTMLYGVGWVIASGTSTTRFVVMSVALAVTLVLGYLRFVRRRVFEDRGDDQATPSTGLASLEQRVATLENRLDQAASALSAR